MPKVTLTEAQREQEAIESMIRKYAGAMRMSIPQAAQKAGIPYTTLYKRLHDPDTFSRREMKRLCKVLKIPDEEKVIFL